MAAWLIKTEPGAYSYADLAKAGRAVWDGVMNPLALKHLRGVRKGDTLFVYHTGDEKRVVGIAQAAGNSRPDPKSKDPKLAVVDLVPVRPLRKPVPLAAIKADAEFREWELVRMARLSVMPVPPAIEAALMRLAGE